MISVRAQVATTSNNTAGVSTRKIRTMHNRTAMCTITTSRESDQFSAERQPASRATFVHSMSWRLFSSLGGSTSVERTRRGTAASVLYNPRVSNAGGINIIRSHGPLIRRTHYCGNLCRHLITLNPVIRCSVRYHKIHSTKRASQRIHRYSCSLIHQLLG